jgi:hypothetical protein
MCHSDIREFALLSIAGRCARLRRFASSSPLRILPAQPASRLVPRASVAAWPPKPTAHTFFLRLFPN